MRRATSAILALSLGCSPIPEPILVPPGPNPVASAPSLLDEAPRDPLAERPVPTPAPLFSPPEPHVLEGPAGSKIWVVERRALPLVSIAVVVPHGAGAEPADKGGLAVVTADMLDEGAGSRDALAFSAALQELGASLHTFADRDMSGVSLDVLAPNLDAALALLADAILQPKHAATDFARVSALWKNSLRARGDDPADVARLVTSAALFGITHPYGRPLEGTLASTGRVSLDDVTRWHKLLWRGDQMTFIVAGDIDKGDARARIERAFPSAQLTAPANAPPLRVTIPVASPPAPRVVVVERKDAVQVVMTIARPGVAEGSSSMPGLALMNVALGGSFTSRLNQNLREDHGYTYGARSRFAGYRAAGSFVVRAAIRTDALSDALREALKEVTALAKAGLTDDELRKVRALTRADAIDGYATVRGVVQSLARNAGLGLSPRHDVVTLESQAAASAQDLSALAATHFALEGATVVLVGPRKPIDDALTANSLGTAELRDVNGVVMAAPRPTRK